MNMQQKDTPSHLQNLAEENDKPKYFLSIVWKLIETKQYMIIFIIMTAVKVSFAKF